MTPLTFWGQTMSWSRSWPVVPLCPVWFKKVNAFSNYRADGQTDGKTDIVKLISSFRTLKKEQPFEQINPHFRRIPSTVFCHLCRQVNLSTRRFISIVLINGNYEIITRLLDGESNNWGNLDWCSAKKLI